MSETEQSTTEQTAAPGSGTVVTSNPQGSLEAKLAATTVHLAGMENLSPDVATAVGEVVAAATPLTKSVLSSVLNFTRETGPSAILTPVEGARKQVALYRELQNYINNAPADFRKGFGAILRIVNDQKKAGAFSPRFIFRFVKDMTLGNADRRGLEALFESMVALSDPSGRAMALRQVDLSRVASLSLNAAGTQKLSGFFAT